MVSSLRTVGLALLVCSPVFACADGADGDATTSSTGGGVSWTGGGGSGAGSAQGAGGDGGSSTSNGGMAAEGGAGGTGGDGGDGGATTVSGGGGAGGGEGGGEPETGRAVLLALGNGTAFASSYTPSAGWDNQTLTSSPSARPAIAMRSTSDAIGVFRNSGGLAFTTFDGTDWTSPAAVGQSVTTRATPSIVANDVSAYVLFHGDDFKHYLAIYTSSFNPTAEPVGGAPQQAFGPEPGSITLSGANPVVAYKGQEGGGLFDQTRSAGSWNAAHAHDIGAIDDTPAIVAPTAGPDLMVVFNRSNTSVAFTTRSAGIWSAPADLPDALTFDPVSVAALPGGRAVAAFRGTNDQVYVSLYEQAAWSAPTGIAVANPTTSSPPSVAAGIDGADAELVYVDAVTGFVMHARLEATVWSVPLPVGATPVSSVAIATRP